MDDEREEFNRRSRNELVGLVETGESKLERLG